VEERPVEGKADQVVEVRVGHCNLMLGNKHRRE
jgi:hypothetical protein